MNVFNEKTLWGKNIYEGFKKFTDSFFNTTSPILYLPPYSSYSFAAIERFFRMFENISPFSFQQLVIDDATQEIQYSIPQNVYSLNQIQVIRIGSGLKTYPKNFKTLQPNFIRQVQISPKNPYLINFNNEVFSKDLKTAISINFLGVSLEYTQIEKVDNYCFYNSILHNNEVIFPNTLKTLSTESFVNCNNIMQMYIPSATTTIENRAFVNTTVSIFYTDNGNVNNLKTLLTNSGYPTTPNVQVKI
jgi:hypothetical protein